MSLELLIGVVLVAVGAELFVFGAIIIGKAF